MRVAVILLKFDFSNSRGGAKEEDRPFGDDELAVLLPVSLALSFVLLAVRFVGRSVCWPVVSQPFVSLIVGLTDNLVYPDNLASTATLSRRLSCLKGYLVSPTVLSRLLL